MDNQVAISTKNKKGFTYTLTSFGKAFIHACSKATRPVVDIGAAYGIATIPALQAGAAVIAVDIEESHLLSIANAVDASTQKLLTPIIDKFPDFNLKNESVSAVYMSQVLPFLTGREIEYGIKKVYDWLIPGGEVFVVTFTPYIEHVSSFIPMYEERKRNGVRWAGYIDDLSRFSSHENIYRHLPNQIHHIGLEDLKWVFETTGFVIKEARYFGEEEGPLPEGIQMDGRERIGLIAYKPGNPEKETDSWKPVSEQLIAQVPATIREWLYKPYILSHALKKVCDDFSVEITDQKIKALYSDEISILKCYGSSYGFVRETYLGGRNNPIVYARVTMPYITYEARKDQLDALGNRPIGETLLYNDPSMTRGEIEIKRITENDPLLFDALVHENYYKAVIEKKAKADEIWARRSLFTISGHPLLITEVFMANIPNYVSN